MSEGRQERFAVLVLRSATYALIVVNADSLLCEIMASRISDRTEGDDVAEVGSE